MKNLYTCLAILACSLTIVAQPAPDFTINATNGNTYSLYADFLNQGKTVVIDVFFVACPRCQDIAPDLEVLYQEWGAGNGDVEFIGLSDKRWDSNADVSQYKTDFNQTFLGAGEDGGALLALDPYISGVYGTYLGTPSFVVISPDGTVDYELKAGLATIPNLDAKIAATGAMKPVPIERYDLSGNIVYYDNRPIDQVEISIDDNYPSQIVNGSYLLNEVPDTVDVSFELSKPGTTYNGISTYDIVLMSRHILEIELFDTPYKTFAADVNSDGKVTAFDMVGLRKVVLFIEQELPNRKTWDFQAACTIQSDPYNFDCAPSGNLDQDYSGVDFVGWKYGDLNGNARTNLLTNAAEDRSDQKLTFKAVDRYIQSGDTCRLELTVGAIENFVGLQFTVSSKLDQSVLLDVHGTDGNPFGWQDANFGKTFLDENQITVAWSHPRGLELEKATPALVVEFVALEGGLISNLIKFNSSLTEKALYNLDGEKGEVDLSFVPLPSTPVAHTFSVYPNPAKDWLRLETPEQINDNATIVVYNQLGQVQRTYRFSDINEYSAIDVSGLIPGHYAVKVLDKGTQLVASFLISD